MGREPSRVEQVKAAKDGFDVLADILRYSEAGDYAAVPADDLELRFRWFGLYRQKPNTGHFMFRIRIPGGQLAPRQLRAIADLAHRYGRGFGDITTRQDIQLHWVELGSIKPMFEALAAVGLTSQFACGDTPRNVVGCPLAGVADNEIIDSSAHIAAVHNMYIQGGREFSNLPRKFKAAIGGCTLHCHQPQINDVGLYGVRRPNGETGYGLLVGGGLSSTPHYAQPLRVFVRPDQVLDVARAVAHLFRDEGNRERRAKARLKFVVAEKGWEWVRAEIEKRLGYTLQRDDTLLHPPAVHGDHMGRGRQRDGRHYVGIPIACGRLTHQNMQTIADLAERHAGPAARIRLTNKQNALILDVPEKAVEDLARALADAGLSPHAHALRTSLVPCTGTQFCNLALVETKGRAATILEYLESHTQLDQPLMISVTGCPNSCAHYQIADIGLMGCQVEDPTRLDPEGKPVRIETFNVLLGGCLGRDPQFGEVVARKIPAEQIPVALERLINTYLKDRADHDEPFAAWVRRNNAEYLGNVLQPNAA